MARSLRDLLTQRWLLTQQTQDRANPKRVYYLSMEFLIGRSLTNNIINLGVEALVREDLSSDPRQDWAEVLEAEPDAGLGNGGLAGWPRASSTRWRRCRSRRSATACATSTASSARRSRTAGRSSDPDNWLLRPDPWEVVRPDETVQVPLACSFDMEDGRLRVVPTGRRACWACPTTGRWSATAARRSTRLRLWEAASPDYFDFAEFSSGDFVGALVDRMAAETVTRVLYPDDSTVEGQALRFLQEYFLVGCSLADIVRRFRRTTTTGTPCPTRWPSSSTTRTRRWPWPS